MSVEEARVDDWLSHLAFTSPRPSAFGLTDGLFWGMMSVTGDATGGIVAFDGDLSEARKTDWIYILGGYSLRSSSTTLIGNSYVEFQTGPKIVGSGAGIDRPTFSVAGPVDGPTAGVDPMQTVTRTRGGAQPFLGMPLYADPALAGNYEMVHAMLNINADARLFTFSMWGFLVRPQSFFRGVSPALA